MRYNFIFNEEKRPVVVTIEEVSQKNGILSEVPDDFDIFNSRDWKYDNEVWTYDPLPKYDSSSEIDHPTQLDRIEAQVAYTAMMTDTLLEG